MANTYTQLHIQIVFAVKYRAALIHPDWEISLHKYISGIIQNSGHKPIIVNGMPDHIHILLGLRPVQSISDLVKIIKQQSSRWVNDNGLVPQRFRWQGGFSAFSYSNSDLPRVIKYIENQKEHHRKKTFKEEYLSLLEKENMEYDPRYIFKDPA